MALIKRNVTIEKQHDDWLKLHKKSFNFSDQVRTWLSNYIKAHDGD
jgi:hypothetical protein